MKFSKLQRSTDSKYIQIKRSAYLGSYPILFDPGYRLKYIDIVCTGRFSNGGSYRNATSSALENNSLNIILKEEKVDDFTTLSYVIVGDDAFSMKPFLMKSYTKRN